MKMAFTMLLMFRIQRCINNLSISNCLSLSLSPSGFFLFFLLFLAYLEPITSSTVNLLQYNKTTKATSRAAFGWLCLLSLLKGNWWTQLQDTIPRHYFQIHSHQHTWESTAQMSTREFLKSETWGGIQASDIIPGIYSGILPGNVWPISVGVELCRKMQRQLLLTRRSRGRYLRIEFHLWFRVRWTYRCVA